MQACRRHLPRGQQLNNAAHAGLILARYLPVPVGHSRSPDEKRELFSAARQANKNCQLLYRMVFQQREKWVQALKSKGGELQATQGDSRGPLVEEFALFTPPNQRLVVGLDASQVDVEAESKGKVTTAKSSPKHKRGDRLTVKCFKDAKGKLKFQADDSFVGHIASGTVPSCQEGEFVELWVANVGPQGYTFIMEEPRSKKK